jgi:Predicted nucleic acid-binding protein, contains PIN domain
VILLDANLLIYAHDLTSPFHTPARRWIEEVFSGSEEVRISWTTLLAFLRITTNRRAFANPFSIEEAIEAVESWFAQPCVTLIQPGRRHRNILGLLLRETQASGPLVMDAHLAALAIEHDALLHTTDRDFDQFPGLRYVNPLLPSVS